MAQSARRRRPRVQEEADLIHGSIFFQYGSRTRPLQHGRVSVSVEKEEIAHSTTRKDGTYTLLVNRTRKRRRPDVVRMQVFKEGMCSRVNVSWEAVVEDEHVDQRGGDFERKLIWTEHLRLDFSQIDRTCSMDTYEDSAQVDEWAREGVVTEYPSPRHHVTVLVVLFVACMLLVVIMKLGYPRQSRRTQTNEGVRQSDAQLERTTHCRKYPRHHEDSLIQDSRRHLPMVTPDRNGFKVASVIEAPGEVVTILEDDKGSL